MLSRRSLLSLPGLAVLLLLLCGVAGVVLVSLQRTIEARAEAQAVENVGVITDLLVDTAPGTWAGAPLGAGEQAALQAGLVVLKDHGRLIGLEVWRSDGTPVFLDAGHPAEETSLPDDERVRVRSGDPWIVSSPVGERGVATLDVFVPVLDDAGRPVGVVEALLPEQHLTAHIAAVTRWLQAVAAGVVVVAAATLLVLRRRLRAREHEARHDSLSGLLNRGAFLDDAADVLRHVDEKHPAALLLVDLDGFKLVNDTLGHAAGDELIVQVAAALRRSVRGTDIVARLGGDEFAVLVPDLPARTSTGLGTDDAGLTVAATVLTALRSASFEVSGVEVAVDASIGVAIGPFHGGTVGELLKGADVAMYQAKRARLGTTVYDASQDNHDVADLTVLSELRASIGRGELVLHYQPQIGLADGSVVGVEALVRWNHPQRGLLGPAAFVPQAENTGLMRPLTEWVLREAVAQAACWERAGTPLRVAVNVSPRSLIEDDLPGLLLDLLVTERLTPALLEVEITETAVMLDPDRAAQTVRRIDALGVAVSIDDFGAGYTSLAQLQSLPVRALKIDRGLVTSMIERPLDGVITEALVELGHHLGLSIVAEGVETAEVRERLERLCCDEAQGYLFARPMPAADLADWLATHRDSVPSR